MSDVQAGKVVELRALFCAGHRGPSDPLQADAQRDGARHYVSRGVGALRALFHDRSALACG